VKRPDVEKYEELAEAATEGPWEWDGWLLHSPAKEDDPDYRPVVVEAYRYSEGDPNAELIAASRTAIPELCAWAKHLEHKVFEQDVVLRFRAIQIDSLKALLRDWLAACPETCDQCDDVRKRAEEAVKENDPTTPMPY
jgi:hypothetical protein